MKRPSLVLALALSIGVWLGFSPCAYAELTADEMLQKVDEVRNPAADYTTIATITSYKPNTPTRIGKYEILVKGRENTIVKTLEPQTEHGHSLLMKDKDLWVFFPEVAKPLRISLQQRLMGDVSNGDIARANFAGDYDAQVLRKDEIKGQTYLVLELTAKSESTTYGKVVLWAEEETFWPFKAEFYAISGKFLKTCYYESYKLLAGKLRPSRLVMRDAVVQGQYSVLEYNELNITDIPEKYFTKEYLKKLEY